MALESPELYNESDYKGYLFFTDNKFIAIDYAAMAVSNTGCYVKNTVPILELELKKDELLPDIMDSKEAAIWEESLENTSQVRRMGELPITAVKRIILADYDHAETVAEFNDLDEALHWINRNRS